VLALLATVLIVAYTIIPGVVFRVAFSFWVPLKAFDRTRTQELAYSVVVCVLPFLASWILVYTTPLGRWPFPFVDTWELRCEDYQTVLLACFAEPLAASKDAIWNASLRAAQRQSRMWTWFMTLVIAEGFILGLVASRWGTIQPRLRLQWPMVEGRLTRLLLAYISEWHVLLTDFLFPKTKIHVDLMTTDDRLFRGEALSYTRDRDGKLTGIYLDHAERYDRKGLEKDRDQHVQKPLDQYWKPIGERLYVFADNILSLNIRPEATVDSVRKDIDDLEVVKEARPGAEIEVTVKAVGDIQLEPTPLVATATVGPAPPVSSPEASGAPVETAAVAPSGESTGAPSPPAPTIPPNPSDER
jgi:hypothetical protein